MSFRGFICSLSLSHLFYAHETQSGSVALIKSGQALALRPDVIKSPEYIRELTKLQVYI